MLRSEWLTPRMVRVVLGGGGLAGFEAGQFTDQYVKLIFPPSDADYGHPVDVASVQATHERAQWPVTRTYTVRRWDLAQRELTIDFVVHGDDGLAGPWAAQATPGQLISLTGPRGAYVPDQNADWHLFVGDASALPAIAASLERVPVGVPALVMAEVETPADELALETPGDLRMSWYHRHGAGHGEQLVDAVRVTDLPRGAGQVFVHGDAGFVREVRRYLRAERGIPAASMSASGYWRRGRTDERWRAEKQEWRDAVAEDDHDIGTVTP